MTSREFTLMKAYEAEYGLPDGNLVAGIIAPAIGRHFSGADVTAADYVPIFRAATLDEPEHTPDENRAIFSQYATRFKGDS